MEAGKRVKEEGAPNDLLERIAKDPDFPMEEEQLRSMLDPIDFVGCSVEQTTEYLKNIIAPILDENRELIGMKAELTV